MVTSERSIQGEENTKLAFDEMHGSTPQVLLLKVHGAPIHGIITLISAL